MHNRAAFEIDMSNPLNEQKRIPFDGNAAKYVSLSFNLNEWEDSVTEMPPGALGIQEVKKPNATMALWPLTAPIEELFVVLKRLHRQFEALLPVS